MSVDAHRQAESLMALAEKLEAEGRATEAARLYFRAAQCESKAFGFIPDTRPRTRGIIAVSAVSLYLKAEAPAEAVRQANVYLAERELAPFVHQQLHELLEKAKKRARLRGGSPVLLREVGLPANGKWSKYSRRVMMAGKRARQEPGLDAVLESILKKALELVQGDAGDIRLLDEGEEWLALKVVAGKIAESMPERIRIGEGITGWVAQHQEPCIVPDVNEDDRYIPCHEGTGSELAVPLLDGDRTIGVLNVESASINTFDQSDQALLQASANLAAIAIEQAKMLERATREVETLRTIGSIIASTHKPEEVLELIVQKAVELLGTPSVRIRLIRGEYLDIEAKKGIPPSTIRWMIGQGIIGHVAKTGQPVNESDVRKNLYFMRALRSIKGSDRQHYEQIRSELAVPLKRGKRVIGVISAHSPREAAFSARDVQVLGALANLAATAIENASLLSTIEELHKVGAQIAPSFDETIVLREITARLNEFANVDIPLIYTYDAKARRFKKPLLGSISPQWRSCTPRNEGGSGSTAIQEEKILVVHADDKEGPGISPYARRKGVKTTVAIPLISEATPLAVMYLHFLGQKHRLSDSDKKQLESFAGAIVSVIRRIVEVTGSPWELPDNLRVFRDEINKDLTQRKIVEYIVKLTKADLVLAYLYDQQKSKFGDLFLAELTGEWEQVEPRSSGVGQEAIKSGRLVIADEKSGRMHPFNKLKGVKVSAAYPLVFESRSLGVLYMHFLERHEFSEEEKKAIAVFGTHAAIALERANAMRDLGVLHEIGKNITSGSLTPAETSMRIGEGIGQVVGSSIINIYQYNPADDSFEYLGGENTTVISLGQELPRTSGLGKAAIRTRQSIIAHEDEPVAVEVDGEQVQLGISPSARSLGVKTVACFPLLYNDVVLGILYLHFSNKRRFSETEMLLISHLADQAAIALNNARLYDRLKAYSYLLEESVAGRKPNSDLKIVDPHNVLPTLVSEHWTANELMALLKSLFADRVEIALKPIASGRGGAKVVEVDGVFPKTPPAFVKIGLESVIRRESGNWRDHVLGSLDAYFTVRKAECYQGRLGGIVYNLLGASGDRVLSFALYYSGHTSQEVSRVLDQVFLKLCLSWYEGRGDPSYLNVSQAYKEYLGLPDDATTLSGEVFRENLADYAGQTKLNFPESERSLPNPVDWAARRSDVFFPTYQCITHGDFNGDNILVNNVGSPWLIDFFTTGKGHIFRDFVTLETTVKLRLLVCEDNADYQMLESALLSPEYFSQFPSMDLTHKNQEVQKAFDVLKRLRSLAKDVQMPGDRSAAEYYLCLLFEALRFLKSHDIKSHDRYRALLSAAMLCQRLDKLLQD